MIATNSFNSFIVEHDRFAYCGGVLGVGVDLVWLMWLKDRDNLQDYSMLGSRRQVGHLSICLAWVDSKFSTTARLAKFDKSTGDCEAYDCRLRDLPLDGPGCRKCRSASNISNPVVWLRSMFTSCWTTVQHRVSGSVNFQRVWSEYKTGFGEGPDGNFWIGLDRLFSLTNPTPRKLLILMRVWNNSQSWAHYKSFSVASETHLYKLSVSGFSGSAGIGDSIAAPWDGLTKVITNGFPFTTIDKDNDNTEGNCALAFKGAWWFNSCFGAHLNDTLVGRCQQSATYADASGGPSSVIATMRAKRTKIFDILKYPITFTINWK
uniref:Fibrinogen C-terminal domain-containing protein n=1 Tax=Macrostomum lignano TaxID=282301 RepID=A0A1I8IY01_9PLAT